MKEHDLRLARQGRAGPGRTECPAKECGLPTWPYYFLEDKGLGVGRTDRISVSLPLAWDALWGGFRLLIVPMSFWPSGIWDHRAGS